MMSDSHLCTLLAPMWRRRAIGIYYPVPFTDASEPDTHTHHKVRIRYGRPQRIRVDQGPEFISKDLDLWAYQHDVVLDFSRPGKPTDNAFAESFNGRVTL